MFGEILDKSSISLSLKLLKGKYIFGIYLIIESNEVYLKSSMNSFMTS